MVGNDFFFWMKDKVDERSDFFFVLEFSSNTEKVKIFLGCGGCGLNRNTEGEELI